MNKTISTLLLLCFVAFSVSAQVENAKSDAPKSAVEQNKIAKEKMEQQRAEQTNPQVDNPNAPDIEFDKLVHDYGTITSDSDGSCTFKFTNTGKEPLILSNVRSS